MVLLVYADVGEPVGVIAHGHDNETILRIVGNPAVRSDPNLALQVMAR